MKINVSCSCCAVEVHIGIYLHAPPRAFLPRAQMRLLFCGHESHVYVHQNDGQLKHHDTSLATAKVSHYM